MPVDFVADDPLDEDFLHSLAKALSAGGLDLEPAGGFHDRRTWYDTHDWRLWRAGLLLESHQRRSAAWLRLTDLEGSRVAQTIVQTPAITVDNVPDGAILDRVLSLAGIRALLPRAALEGQVRAFSVLDDEAKTVARIFVDGPLAVAGAGAIGPRARVERLRGYEKAARRTEKGLAAAAGVRRAGQTLFESVVTARGLDPAAYRSKPELSFRPGMAAEAAFAQALRQLLDIVRDNLDGTVQELDTEFLHDFRVAIRRARSVLKAANGVIPEQRRLRMAAEMKWLADATSRSRDLDVYLLGFDAMTSQISVSAQLEPFRALLTEHCGEAHAALNAVLRSSRFATLLDDWQAELTNPDQAPDGSAGTVDDVARQRLLRAWKRVDKRGSAITTDSPADDLHDLRKRCKELRYLLEFFASLYQPKTVSEFIGELKRLQDNLGEFQDAESQRDLVVHSAEELTARGAPAVTLLAMGRLEQVMEHRQEAAREEFAGRWKTFSRPHDRRLFATMVGSR
jgi:CHAD domain-containing protein